MFYFITFDTSPVLVAIFTKLHAFVDDEMAIFAAKIA